MDRPNSLFVSPRPQTLVSKPEQNRETNRNWGSVQRLCYSMYSAKGFLWIMSNNYNTPSMQAFPPQFRAVQSEGFGRGLIELVSVTQRVRVGLGLDPRVISCSGHVCVLPAAAPASWSFSLVEVKRDLLSTGRPQSHPQSHDAEGQVCVWRTEQKFQLSPQLFPCLFHDRRERGFITILEAKHHGLLFYGMYILFSWILANYSKHQVVRSLINRKYLMHSVQISDGQMICWHWDVKSKNQQKLSNSLLEWVILTISQYLTNKHNSINIINKSHLRDIQRVLH